MGDYGGNCDNVNMKGTKINVVSLVVRTQMIDQKINSAVHVKVLK